jgi:hypothetical protein
MAISKPLCGYFSLTFYTEHKLLDNAPYLADFSGFGETESLSLE